jgi:hypothetical protein
MEEENMYAGWLREFDQPQLQNAGREDRIVPKQWELYLPRTAIFFQASPGGDMKIMSTVTVIGLQSLTMLQL